MENRQVLALGFFDGVHLGHGALLRACRQLADRLGVYAGAVTFSVHPDALVAGKAPGLINTEEDRVRLMKERYGMDRVILLPFDRAMMQMPWQDFFSMLLSKYGAAGLVCGEDFRFGNRGEGTAAALKRRCREAGIPCTVVPEQKVDGITVSSTHIRGLLEAGDMEKAARFLGHPHVLSGSVVSGRHLGRTIGTPTANLTMPEGLLCPRHGVYACMAEFGGQRYPAVTNVGTRPTVGGAHVTVEPWILGYAGDLYGETVALEFHKFLREEKKFASMEELQLEIRKNAEQTLEFFGKP